MIQTLQIKGFRSLRDVSWEPGKLNVLIGPNGSGKSNLLRALSLLQRSAQGGLSEAILRQGGIGALLWDGQEQEMSWSITEKTEMAYELRLRRLGATSAYRVEDELLADFFGSAILNKFLERRPGHAATFDDDERMLNANEGSVPDDESLLSLIAGPFAKPAILAFRDRCASWGIYHDLHVDPNAPLRQPAVARLEKRVAPDGQNLIPVLHTLYTSSRDFKNDVDQAMQAAFGEDFEDLTFPPAADQRVQMRLRWRSLKSAQSAADLSDGTIRFLLLLAILANPEPESLIAIDEPEAGLHPGMLPIVAEFAREAARKSQVILTTHSPQFLDAFGQEPPTTTITQWVDGATQLSVVDGEELARWLAEYSLGALFRSGELEAMR
ncbi:MAG TPA: chromosome segregation protein SMC [Acidobacteria bacterium]|nr:chromosome segregation protein SMC [Acidobacteriota bacterium]